MNANPYEYSDFVDERPKKTGRKFSLIGLLTILGVIGILIALLLPATRTAGPAARRMQCMNNLKQIALALRDYESTYKAFPPAFTVDSDGKPLHSWRTLILPYLGARDLYERIDLSKPWNDPANAEAFKAGLGLFRCPNADCPANQTVYMAIVAPGGCFRTNGSRALSEITDGQAETLMVIELGSEHAVPWMAPTDADESSVMGFGPQARLNHSGGTNAAFVDGSVRFLGAEMPAPERRALISIAGNDK